MQEEVTQKTIALSMKTGKLTAQVLQMALKKYLEARKHGPKLHHGQQSLKQLKQHGAALSNIEITDANIAAFKPCAKKYGVDFTLRKDKTTQPPHYIVIFKSRDADNLEQAFKEFTAKKLSREAKPSIRKALSVAVFLGAGLESGDIGVRDLNVGQHRPVLLQLLQALLAVVELGSTVAALFDFWQRRYDTCRRKSLKRPSRYPGKPGN
mgnify:CR=1 FL=1